MDYPACRTIRFSTSVQNSHCAKSPTLVETFTSLFDDSASQATMRRMSENYSIGSQTSGILSDRDGIVDFAATRRGCNITAVTTHFL